MVGPPIHRRSCLGARIDEAALPAGRDPSTIRRLVNPDGVITDGADGADGEVPLDGPVNKWEETLTGRARLAGRLSGSARA